MSYRALAETIEIFESSDCSRAEDRAVIERYLAALAPALAHAVLGQTIIAEIQEIDRIFGHTWLKDAVPFNEAFAKWREFRDEYLPFAVRGMTVNERLHAFGLLDAYDRAAGVHDVSAIRQILESVYVDADSIENIVSRINDPTAPVG